MNDKFFILIMDVTALCVVRQFVYLLSDCICYSFCFLFCEIYESGMEKAWQLFKKRAMEINNDKCEYMWQFVSSENTSLNNHEAGWVFASLDKQQALQLMYHKMIQDTFCLITEDYITFVWCYKARVNSAVLKALRNSDSF